MNMRKLLFIMISLYLCTLLFGCNSKQSVNTSNRVDAGKNVKVSALPTIEDKKTSEIINKYEGSTTEKILDFKCAKLSGEEIDKIKNIRNSGKNVVSKVVDKLTPLLISDFKVGINNLENNFSPLNLVMAKIKALPMLILNFADDDADFFMKKKELLNNEKLLNAPIYSCITFDGVVLVGITPQINHESEEFVDSANQIACNSNEMAMLDEIKEKTDYFPVDIYALDLIGTFDKIPIDWLNLSSEKTNIPRFNGRNQNFDSIDVTALNADKKLTDILKKYNRIASREVVNKQWNLFLFKKPSFQTKAITISYENFTENDDLKQQDH